MLRKIKLLLIFAPMFSTAWGQPLLSQIKGGSGGHVDQIVLSHNDYRQHMPFGTAYGQGVHIMEADLRMRGRTIVVAHDLGETGGASTLQELYIDPIVKLGAKAAGMKMMFDLKEPQVIGPLVKLLSDYPAVFRPGGVEVIISGSKPDPETFASYPDFIWFDGDPEYGYGKSARGRIWMFSASLADYTGWNGKGSIPVRDKSRLIKLIDGVHARGGRVRFWQTTDNVNTWITLNAMGVDVISTVRPSECMEFFAGLGRRSSDISSPHPTYTPDYGCDGKPGPAKNIIVIIGDGMGLAHMSAAETANRGELSIMKMKNIGLQRNSSLDYYNTDSSAAATALFTGEKTMNGMLSVRPDSTPIPNICDVLVPRRKRVGVISTDDITDATPAACYAHSPDRNDSRLIAGQLPQSGLSLLAGTNGLPFTRRSDGRNIYDEMRALGYTVIHDIDSIAVPNDRVICIDDKKFKALHMESPDSVMRDAIRLLDNPDGFFLMFESARIDHASHLGNLSGAVIEAQVLDVAVAEALRFADIDGNTLVIVTGDHETGGLGLLSGDRRNGRVSGYFVSDDHTGIMLPVYAYGVGAGEFRGFYENTDIFDKIISAYGFTPVQRP